MQYRQNSCILLLPLTSNYIVSKALTASLTEKEGSNRLHLLSVNTILLDILLDVGCLRFADVGIVVVLE